MVDYQYMIYQLKDGHETRKIRFEPLERLTQAGLAVDWENYKHVYTGTPDIWTRPPMVDLEKIFEKFNMDHPQDFTGHSLSVSDVVVLCRDGKATAYYVHSFGFKEVPDFLDAPYKYYSTQRPVDIATYPKTDGGPVHFVNFDKREYVENATFRAWGYLAYDNPLTDKQISDYELRAASGNPDNIRISPYQFAAQLDVIGKWEKGHHLSEVNRLTQWYPDFGVFVKKESVPQERITLRFLDITDMKDRAVAEKQATPKRIAEQLSEGAKQAAADNAARSAPPKDKDITR